MIIGQSLLAGLLVSPLLVGLGAASPVADIAARATTQITTQTVSKVVPTTVTHGVLDNNAIKKLISALDAGIGLAIPTALPNLAPRQGGPLAVTTASSGAFASADLGAEAITDCSKISVDGPIKDLQFFTGTSNVRSFSVTNINGTTTNFNSAREKGTDAGTFSFDFDERITEFIALVTAQQFTGFNFTTSKGRTYAALSSIGAPVSTAIKIPVGSGIIGRIRGTTCPEGIFSSMGFDFIDDIKSVAVVNIDYSGFTNNILPSGPGQTINIGTQSIDNRNSSIEQSTSIQTTSAVTKQHSLTTNFGWNFGSSVTISGGVGIPLLTEGSVSSSVNWGLQKSTSVQDLDGETFSTAGTINLACPPRKFCIGTSFFNMFKLDVKIKATLQATTNSGAKYTWIQSGSYSGADSAALQFRVDIIDAPPS